MNKNCIFCIAKDYSWCCLINKPLDEAIKECPKIKDNKTSND
jgi:hypothetical protein